MGTTEPGWVWQPRPSVLSRLDAGTIKFLTIAPDRRRQFLLPQFESLHSADGFK